MLEYLITAGMSHVCIFLLTFQTISTGMEPHCIFTYQESFSALLAVVNSNLLLSRAAANDYLPLLISLLVSSKLWILQFTSIASFVSTSMLGKCLRLLKPGL